MHIFGFLVSFLNENQHQICWRLFSSFDPLENTECHVISGYLDKEFEDLVNQAKAASNAESQGVATAATSNIIQKCKIVLFSLFLFGELSPLLQLPLPICWIYIVHHFWKISWNRIRLFSTCYLIVDFTIVITTV